MVMQTQIILWFLLQNNYYIIFVLFKEVYEALKDAFIW